MNSNNRSNCVLQCNAQKGTLEFAELTELRIPLRAVNVCGLKSVLRTKAIEIDNTSIYSEEAMVWEDLRLHREIARWCECFHECRRQRGVARKSPKKVQLSSQNVMPCLQTSRAFYGLALT